jgi:hypothetical protein
VEKSEFSRIGRNLTGKKLTPIVCKVLVNIPKKFLEVDKAKKRGIRPFSDWREKGREII